MRAYSQGMRTQDLSVCAHTRVCVRKLRVSCSLSSPKIVLFFHNNSSSQDFTRLGPKPTLGVRVMLSLGNRSLSCKGYEMRCLQVPNQPWALEWCYHWGIGAWVVRGKKWGVYTMNQYSNCKSPSNSKLFFLGLIPSGFYCETSLFHWFSYIIISCVIYFSVKHNMFDY